MGTKPIRVDGELFNAAKSSGAVHSRSTAQQIAHWARIGRELESSANVSQRDIEAVLAGHGSYDALGERGQAVVRAAWDECLAERIATFDLGEVIERDGVGWAENDEHGNVTVTDPTLSPRKSPTRVEQ